MDEALLRQLSVITAEEKALLESPQRLDYAAYGATKEDFRIDARRLLQSGRLMRIRPHTRFVHFPPHTHNYIEMVYMYTGQTQHIVNGTPITLHTGEVLLLSPSAVQEVLPAGEKDIAINFIILPAFFDRTMEMLGMEQNRLVDFLADCLSPTHRDAQFLHFAVADILPIQNLLENLIWTILHEEPNRRRIRQSTMGLLMVQLANHMDRLQGADSAQHRFSAAVLRYIEEHYRDASLTVLAADMEQEAGTLSKQITRHFGCTFKALLREKRLQRAAALLVDTDRSVADIIVAVGYENTSYFHRIFKEKYGISPAAYRRGHVE